jgi:glycosyltransferase involved in cell wall biosynthesis
MMSHPPRKALATLGGLVQPPAALARGTPHAAFTSSHALIALGHYTPVHVYHEAPERVARGGPDGAFVAPAGAQVGLRSRARLPFQTGQYAAVYAAEGELQGAVPHALRPWDDWVPVIAETGTTHHRAQWCNLFVAATTGALRATDGLVLKSRAHARILADVWDGWQRAGLVPLPRPASAVIPNGVDPAEHRRDDDARRATRAELGVAASDVLFLCFTRLSPGTKGDLAALIASWRHVTAACPQALLALSGATVDRRFEDSLATTARLAGVANRVLLLPNPYDLWPRARTRLLSAADAFVHLTTGIEEACPQVVLQAMAHGLPVVASDWAGIRDVVTDGEHGHLIRTVAAPPPGGLGEAYWGRSTEAGNVELGHSAACDHRQAVQAAVALARDGELRARMGAQARRRIEDRHTLVGAARQKFAFMEACAQEARAAWRGPGAAEARRAFVDVDQVLAVQAAAQLHPEDQVLLGDRTALAWLPDRLDPGARTLIAAVLERLAGGATPAFGALAAQLGAGQDSPEGRALGALLLRLWSHGVVELVPATSPPAPPTR